MSWDDSSLSGKLGLWIVLSMVVVRFLHLAKWFYFNTSAMGIMSSFGMEESFMSLKRSLPIP